MWEWARPSLRWTTVVHLTFNLGFAFLPALLLWLAFRQSLIAGVVMGVTMYFPHWWPRMARVLHGSFNDDDVSK